jgi:starch phosphorylase
MLTILDPQIAYFSMEIELEEGIPTYSGGLGVLAGDTLRSAADLGVPLVAVSLVYRHGYFHQSLDKSGRQSESPDTWAPNTRLERVSAVVPVQMENRVIHIGAWKYLARSNGRAAPVILLDTAIEGNGPWDVALTDCLYGGDDHYRLCQELILGIGGYAMLAALGYKIKTFHMNEGHSALLTLALLEEQLAGGQRQPSAANIDAVRQKCVFTTHTPVPAAFDKFNMDLVRRVLGQDRAGLLEAAGSLHDGVLNMTYLALRGSHYINGVGMHHGDISRGMFPEYPVRAITNGVHAETWTAPPFQELYDRHIPEWREDNLYLRYAIGIASEEIGAAHKLAKQTLLDQLGEKTGTTLDPKLLTLGFARRAAQYKRPNLVFANIERLRTVARQVGSLQIVFGGKAHPNDETGKEVIRQVFEAAAALRDSIRVIYVENYDAHWGKLITSGVDVWLNTPHRPFEASGTSGMKAALNGVPSLSILDGWWIEGCVEGVTGWAIGTEELPTEDYADEVASLYDKLERVVVPMYYGRPAAFREMMRLTISLNGSFFNTQRMLEQYVSKAYRLD